MYNRDMGVILSLERMRVIENANFVTEPAGVLHPDRRMTAHDILYTIAGTREIIEDDNRFTAAPGDVLFLAAGRHHWAEKPAPNAQRAMYLHFKANAQDGFSSGTAAVPAGAVHIPTLVHTRGNIIVKKLFEEMIYHSWSSRPLKRMKANTLLAQFLIELALLADTTSDPISGPIEYVIERIERNPALNESLDAIAKRVGFHRKALTRNFSKVTGLSIGDYRTRVKITNAISMLAVSPTTAVKNVASRLGFYDEYHFSRVFKSVTGVSPAAFRRGQQG